MKNKRSLLLIICFFVFVSGVTLPSLFSARSKSFETLEWKAAHSYFFRNYPFPTRGGHIERARMVDDLLAHHLRLGMTRKSVCGLLGPSDVIDGTGDHGPIDIYELVEKPAGFQMWQAYLWSRYRTDEPRLALEYGGADSHLIGISVG